VFAVFESEEGMQLSGFSPVAKLLGAYTAAESCTNALGQLESGEGYVRAGQGAIDISGLKNHQISTVKTHGTGTLSNNVAECTALYKLLPDGFIATSYKPKIGHTMGASGLLESALLINDLRNTGLVPAIKNRTETDDVFLSKPAPPINNRFLSLAAGMGNIYSAAIFLVE
jgi:3-oxoacyl-(acyl-carrier-protein) synthase